MSVKIYGEFTRDLYGVWQTRAENASRVRLSVLPMTFHDMRIFPSKSQVHEMLHCASECSHRPNADYITFGEFCVFSSELKSKYRKRIPRPIPLSKISDKIKSSGKLRNTIGLRDSMPHMKYEVFLGGSCNPTTWRQDIAIPMLKSLGITYYNPQVTHWGPELIELESQAKQSAEVLFFVVDNQTRSVASVIECGHLSGCRRKLILVIKPYEGPGQLVLGEPLSEKEHLDLNHAQTILQDLVERQGIPVFENIAIALNCTARILKEGLSVQDLGLDDFVQPVKMAHVQLGDKLIKLRETFDNLDVNGSEQLTLREVCMAFKILTDRELTFDELRSIVAMQKKRKTCKDVVEISMDKVKVDFEQFCCIYTEFKDKKNPSNGLIDDFVFTLANILRAIASPFRQVLNWLLRGYCKRRAVSSCNRAVKDIYLGGSCGLTTWRLDKAIPILKKSGLTCFNPQTSRWSERLIPIEAAAIENCRVLLFVITNTSRSLAAMALAAHYIGLGCNTVLCVQYLVENNCVIAGEKISQQAVRDYNRGRVYLSDLANRDGVPVFEDIVEAVNCAVQKCRNVIVDK